MVRTISAPVFRGAFTALITPFRDDAIDEAALRRLVDYQIGRGIAGLVPCGTTGESATMTDDERDRVIEIVVDQTAGRVPVIAGTGGNDTRRTIEATRRANELGADAALVVVPYYNKPTQAGMLAHYTAVAESTDLPLVLYNVPGRTGVTMTAETTLELASLPSVAGIKEASGSLDLVSQIIAGVPDEFAVLSGDDSLTVPVMSIGASGVISVASNIVPAEISRLANAGLLGDFGTASALHHELFPLMQAMFIENNPTAVKTAAAMLGFCSDELRLPLTSLSAESRAAVGAAVASYAMIGA